VRRKRPIGRRERKRRQARCLGGITAQRTNPGRAHQYGPIVRTVGQGIGDFLLRRVESFRKSQRKRSSGQCARLLMPPHPVKVAQRSGNLLQVREDLASQPQCGHEAAVQNEHTVQYGNGAMRQSRMPDRFSQVGLNLEVTGNPCDRRPQVRYRGGMAPATKRQPTGGSEQPPYGDRVLEHLEQARR